MNTFKTCADVPKYLKPYIKHSIQRAWDYQQKLRDQVASWLPSIGDPSKDQEHARTQINSLKRGIEWFDQRIEDGDFATLEQCNGARFVIDWQQYYDDRADHYEHAIDQYTQLLERSDERMRPLVQYKLDDAFTKLEAVNKHRVRIALEQSNLNLSKGSTDDSVRHRLRADHVDLSDNNNNKGNDHAVTRNQSAITK